ncbi:hypothetical protein V6N11_055965 [Hibiscus sabdariffa]|uniref:DUF4283 domain-containing protein n=1 Tax=Hibiscus sabdariffa TaxID=183260 RepID=A0ABR2T399_9ROSI
MLIGSGKRRWRGLRENSPMVDGVSMGIGMLARELNEAEIMNFSLMRLAVSRMLMMFSSSDTRQNVLESGGLCKWFSKVANWEPGIEIGNKRAWLSVFEIPLHVWLRVTFENIALIWGTLIRSDDLTLEPNSFEQGHILIEIDQFECINELVVLQVQGLMSRVCVVEFEPSLEEQSCLFCERAYESELDCDGDELGKGEDDVGDINSLRGGENIMGTQTSTSMDRDVGSDRNGLDSGNHPRWGMKELWI